MKSPSWKSLIGGSGALFVVVGAFLAGRVHAGTDPAVGKAQTQTQTQTPQVQQQQDDQGFDDGGGSAGQLDQNPPTTQAS
jgi:hypothetical protein